MVKHYVVHMDLEGPHAPDLSGHVQELIDAGYVVMRADIIETSCGSPVSSPLSALTAAQEFALAGKRRASPKRRKLSRKFRRLPQRSRSRTASATCRSKRSNLLPSWVAC